MSWQYVMLKGFAKLVGLLPYSWLQAIGSCLGWVYYHAARKQRLRAEKQMTDCLKWPREKVQRTVRHLFDHLGKMFAEVLYTPKLNPKNVDQYIQLEGREHLETALAEGKGVVLLTAHLGNWEWLGAALGLYGYPVTSVVKRQPNAAYTELLNEHRRQAGIEVFARGTAEMVAAAKALKKGKILGFVADQDGGPEGIWVDFLGRKSATPAGPAVFARRFGSTIVPAFIRRHQQGHTVTFLPGFKSSDFPDAPEESVGTEVTKEMVRLTEAFIRRTPEQWLWFQKRWNTSYEKRKGITHEK